MAGTDSSSGSTRSSSPATSDALSDDHARLDNVDFSAWCHPFPESDGVSLDTDELRDVLEVEKKEIRQSETLVQEQLSEPVIIEAPLAVNPAVFHNKISQPPQSDMSTPLDLSFLSQFSSDNSSSESAPVPELIPRTPTSLTAATKVVPPPPMQPRKLENAASHRVIFPAKESCYNLAILTPNIPLTGAKSRVETQVRVTLDLALTSGTSADPSHYDRIGSWKWLKLPKGTATRKRSRKEGKIDASPMDTLYLDAEVSCASNPSKLVTSCATCQGREAKRVARKIAARVRPARSDSESNDGDGTSSSKIIQFNCPDTLDFSGGSVVLPLRITCYCRHHREKVGFNVHFTMKDVSGRIVGKGSSPPIMITDDHKSTDKNSQKYPQTTAYLGDMNWEARIPVTNPSERAPVDLGAVSRKRQTALKDGSLQSRKRTKPYDDTRPATSRFRRTDVNGNVDTTVLQPSITDSDASLVTAFSPISQVAPYDSMHSFSAYQRRESMSALPSPPNSSTSPISPNPAFLEANEMFIRNTLVQPTNFFPLSPPNTAPSSPPTVDLLPPTTNATPMELSSAAFAYNLLNLQPEHPASALPMPKIHRLIPSSGPTYGGIEVTVLGSNFHASIHYNCVFGDVVASSTSRWSEDTLVCVLPPRACSGVVPVTLEGFKPDGRPEERALFTYVNESDRALMELALQVVGLKMSGKVEDAKDIAMRIVGNSNSVAPTDNSNGISGILDMGAGTLPDYRRLLLCRIGDPDFERLIIESLSALDLRDGSGEPMPLKHIISRPTKTGQTLLHLSVSLNLPLLVESLIERDIDLDAQDVNGYTALHFAVVSGSSCCARQLINAGARIDICTKMGRSALELAPEGFFAEPCVTNLAPSVMSDDESHFGDNEEDSENESRSQMRSHLRRRIRRPRSHRSSVPASVVSDDSDMEQPNELDDDNATIVSPEGPSLSGLPGKDSIMDEKQAASFANYLQRAWAQLQAPQFVSPMPEMAAWAFPVLIPMPAWPAFRNEGHGKQHDDEAKAPDGSGPSKEWRTAWVRWTQMGAALARQSQLSAKTGGPLGLDLVPETPPVPVPTPVPSGSIFRRSGRGQQPPPVSEKEVNAYSYRPSSKSLVKTVKKEDRMLFFFWIPIIIVAIVWLFYKTYPILAMLKQEFPTEDISERRA